MENLLQIIEKFPGKRIVVIGDIMLDKYVHGEVERISPEAPVPVVKVDKEYFSPGGAANVAANISSLQGEVDFFGFIGEDESGNIIRKIIEEKGIKSYFEKSLNTTLKIRIIGRNQQFLRLDYDEAEEKSFSSETKKEMEKSIDKADIIVISDYAKGAITQDLMNFLKQKRKRIIVDPKPKNMHLYKEVFLITPNEKEALEMTGEKDIYSAVKKLKEHLNSNIIITRGEKGMLLYADKQSEIPTYALELYDVTGAGDTVISALALSLSTGSSLEEAAIIANHAAGISVSKSGAYQVKLSELKEKLAGEISKTKLLNDLVEIVADLKRKGQKVVWTNGCFDLLHIGHINYLKKAKELGDCLIVGINSDESVRKLKGSGRPINNEKNRADIISALEFVDYIIIFTEEDVTKYLAVLKPDIYVKGGDYNLEKINKEEKKILESYGSKIVFLPFIEGASTSKIIEKIKSS